MEKSSKVLTLTLQKKWFDLILSGEKREEYREVKMHWINQFVSNKFGLGAKRREKEIVELILTNKEHYSNNRLNTYDYVRFINGYGEDKPQFIIECKGMTIGIGKESWGAPDYPVFKISLGNIIEKKNINS